MKEWVIICLVMYCFVLARPPSTLHQFIKVEASLKPDPERVFIFLRKSYTMHQINRQRYVHDCLDKKIVMATASFAGFGEVCDPQGAYLCLGYTILYWYILFKYAVLECPSHVSGLPDLRQGTSLCLLPRARLHILTNWLPHAMDFFRCIWDSSCRCNGGETSMAASPLHRPGLVDCARGGISDLQG
jgi:hypothetical protein